MPWQEITTVDLRTEFIELSRCGTLSFSELCRRYGISRKTGYKWVRRHEEQGVEGLHDRSRRPIQQPARTSAETEDLILACRDRYPAWGARKLRTVLVREGHLCLPALSTITAILRRHGRLNAPAEPTACIRFEHTHPNELWQMDFKGHVPVGQQRCHPLTVIDDCSRFSLCLHACGNEQRRTVQSALLSTFRRYGLPQRMTMENGPPWGAGGGNGRFSRLTVWLIEQGITVSHSRPYHPQTQGKDERFHRTLKAELLGRKQFASLGHCQRAFNRWRQQYNEVRPHEALQLQTPASRYEPSQRRWLEYLPPYEYGPIDEVRKVASDQSITFQRYVILVGEGFVGKYIALRPTLVDGQYTLHFCHQQIGQVDLRNLTKRVR
ncbi:IS481 family transposase [Pseudomonas sp. MYb185]|uniref:IS481 family transposase n=1 Tax=Pseudomonas sp. MYb185 TaxID=1848729 RepID=UPI000CFB9946|nr:IS481 family transposase [Pseudomonas sp. MYb185]PRB73413.1 IS481 family transposase [Pseudomonas sp. MYb185]